MEGPKTRPGARFRWRKRGRGGAVAIMEEVCGPALVRSVLQPVHPIVGIPVEVYDGQDTHDVGAILKQKSVGESSGEVPADFASHTPVCSRVRARFRDQAFNFIIKATTQLGADICVILSGRRVLCVCFAMESVRFHRPTI